MKPIYNCLILFSLINIYSKCEMDPQKLEELAIDDNEKFVIGACGWGFFSDFFAILNNLRWCEENHKIPVVYWDNMSLYYDPDGYNGAINAWEYYFEPVSEFTYQVYDPIYRTYWTHNDEDLRAQKIDANTRIKTNLLIRKYIKIKDNIQKKIETFFQKNMQDKRTIGIHLRGTDKVHDIILVPLLEIISTAKTYADEDTQFFIASDDSKLFNEAKKLLGEKVISYDSFRTDTTEYLWWKDHASRAKLGEEVLIEAQLLSRCDFLVHTYASNVSAAALFFNPDLKNILLVNSYKKIKL